MSELADKLQEELEQLRTLRDELRVKVELGKMEARDRYEQAEKTWSELDGKLQLIRRETEQPMHDVAEAARLLLHEIAEAYRHVRKAV